MNDVVIDRPPAITAPGSGVGESNGVPTPPAVKFDAGPATVANPNPLQPSIDASASGIGVQASDPPAESQQAVEGLAQATVPATVVEALGTNPPQSQSTGNLDVVQPAVSAVELPIAQVAALAPSEPIHVVEQAIEIEFTSAELAEIEIEANKLLTEVNALPLMIYARSLAHVALNHDIFDYHRYYDEKTPSHPNDVLRESMRLIAAERKLGKTITDRQVRMSAVIAMLHDFGMDHTAATPQEARKDHEKKGVEKFGKLVKPVNLGEEFTPEEILQMEKMFPPTELIPDNPDFVQMTQMTQFPAEDSLAMITQDGDMSNLGMSAEVTLQNSRREYNELKSQDPVGFLRFFTEKILSKHQWKTDAAKKLYGAQHKRNIEFYRELVTRLATNPPTDLKNPF